MKMTRKILASVLALVMVLMMLPAAFAAEEENVYVMEASELEPMEATKADGDTDDLGTDGYFTMYYGAKTKVDGSTKDFEDGYHAEQRINFQGKTVIGETTAYCVEFTTASAATITLWWVSGGDGRQFHIFDVEGNVIASTDVESVKNSKYISELTVEEAGTYYIGLVEGSNYLFKAQVAEETEAGSAAAELPMGATEINGVAAYQFTAPADGTLNLKFASKSPFVSSSAERSAVYAINGGTGVKLEEKKVTPVSLNQGDEVFIDLVAAVACILTVEWIPNETAACQHTNTTVTGAQAATCTEAGFTGNTVCADCNEQITAGTAIAALGHAFAEGTCTTCGAADPDYVAPVVENKTITIGDKTFTTVDGKWAFNQEMTAANSTKYNMIIMTKAFTGSFATNGWGVAIVLDQYGTLVRVYDGANSGAYWTVEGKAPSAHFGANDYAIVAWNELQEGETLVVFTHTGSEGNVARQFGLNVRSLCGQTATLTGFEFQAPACQHTNTTTEGTVEATCEEKGFTGNTVCADCGELIAEGTEIAALGHNYEGNTCTVCGNPKTFDVFGIMVAVMAASGTALVCLKKKED